eukprot:gnl/TRDRNA2_/TRDRNA2_199251_c0_seq1.p1 gnl/TRDRNA2_/TRDRNA2_199251_c0~~gnl/TRDRNA2_/TRDRNA2_199251_c0_seq1.p1  ORF type:complete len:334 (+),score=52.53 gnl/TRDRNA2_/TRDRNA2_199251_c0_seq1:68-1069(+)
MPMPGGLNPSNFWDSDLVARIAFHPRKCMPESNLRSGSGWTDSKIQVSDGVSLAYRLYVAPPTSLPEKRCILIYFHANAELCTDLETEISVFHEIGAQLVLCPEFRGYAWSTGKPSISKLATDAEAFVEMLPQILEEAGAQDLGSLPTIAMGRSLGAACAIQIAAGGPPGRIAGLVLESGIVSIKELPMVAQLGLMMPDVFQMMSQQPDPLGNLAKLKQISCPTLFIHGDQDEMIPVKQAIEAHKTCRSVVKKLVRYPQGHHNDIRMVARKEYYSEVRTLFQIVADDGPVEALAAVNDTTSHGMFGFIADALRCLPGVRRCLHETGSATEDRQ